MQLDAQPERTMSERCVTITLRRYNELVEAEEKLNSFFEADSEVNPEEPELP